MHLDEDGAPTDIRMPERPFDHVEEAILHRTEQELGVWISWEDRWRKDEDHWCRPIDLMTQQPTHRVRFIPDGDEEIVEDLLLADIEADGTGISWSKNEWYSKGANDGGAWGLDREGCWRHRGQITPEGVPGVAIIEELTEERPKSVRRAR